MKRPDDFETQEQFDSYVDYMMGNPADDWGLPELEKVYWCSKAGGHWDDEGVCSSHYTGEYIWWDFENNNGFLPCADCKKPAPTENCPWTEQSHLQHGHLCLECSEGYDN